MARQKLTQLKYALLAALLSVSFAIGTFSPVFAANIADSDISETLSGNVLDHQLYYYLSSCFATIDMDKATSDEVGSWRWFWGSSAMAYRGDMYEKSFVNCSDGQWLQEAFGRFGYTDPLDTFCSLSFTYNRKTGGLGKTVGGGSDVAACKAGMNSGDFDGSGSRDDQLKALQALLARASNGAKAKGALTPAEEYVQKYRTFMRGCNITITGQYDETADPAKNDSKVYKVPIVTRGTDGNTTVADYVGTGNADQAQQHLIATTSGLRYQSITCGQLATDLRKLAASYAAYLNGPGKNDSTPATTPSTGNSDSGADVCSAGSLGWVICPAIDFISTMNDAAYAMVENMLVINPVTVSTNGPLYGTWTKFRDIANVLFIVAVLVVVFSQATSLGLSSYGIKKLLPRIIAAAILVNISFFLCQIAIDISNIVGVSIHGMFETMYSGSKVDVDLFSWSSLIAAIIGGGAIAGVGIAILGAQSLVAALAMLLPFLVTAMFAVVTAIAVLIARQVIIVLLVAIAPLAFVAWILPNTQKYFQMWQNTLTTMLIMFPLVAALFAGSKLAANIVLTSSTSGDGISLYACIAAICMLFLPLFGVPYIVKFSGGVMGRIANVVNNPNKGPFDKLRKQAEGYRDYKQDQARLRNQRGEFGTGLIGATRKNTFGRYSQQRAARDAVRGRVKAEAEAATSEYIAERSISTEDTKFAERMAGGKYQGSNLPDAVRRVQAAGIAHEREESRKRVAAIQQRILRDREEIKTFAQGHPQEGQVDFSQGMGKIYADAAARGDHETMAAVINEAHKQGSFGRQATAEMITKQQIGGITPEAAQAAQFEVTQAIYGLSLPARSDIVKGQMGPTGTWQLKDVAALATEQKAALDGNVLREAIYNGKISQPEATRIVTTNLRDKVESQELINMLQYIVDTGTPPSRPANGGPNPPSGPQSAPPTGS